MDLMTSDLKKKWIEGKLRRVFDFQLFLLDFL